MLLQTVVQCSCLPEKHSLRCLVNQRRIFEYVDSYKEVEHFPELQCVDEFAWSVILWRKESKLTKLAKCVAQWLGCISHLWKKLTLPGPLIIL